MYKIVSCCSFFLSNSQLFKQKQYDNKNTFRLNPKDSVKTIVG